MRRVIRIEIAGVVVAAAAFALTLWLLPAGTGEYLESPNGRFMAHALNMTRGTFFSGRIQYIEIRIVETVTDRAIWRVEFLPHAGHQIPDYGDRSQPPSIRWTNDSSLVTIPIDATQSVTFPLP